MVLTLPLLLSSTFLFLSIGFLASRVPQDLDAVVIGSGIGGLSIAVLLSRVGKKVLVLEQHDRAGGCCHTFSEKGFEFDVGENAIVCVASAIDLPCHACLHPQILLIAAYISEIPQCCNSNKT